MNTNPFNTSRVEFRSIGKCIYCKRSDIPLSEEHIVPYGLNGNFVIRDASCKRCGAITSAFELDILRNTFMLPRKVFNMRSRHSKKDNKAVPARMETGGSTLSIKVPANDCPVFFALPIYLLPAVLDNRPSYQFGIQGTGIFNTQLKDMEKDELKKKYGTGTVSFNISYKPVNFARMIAKIGYSLSIAVFGFENIEDIGILSSIMGETDDIGKWVGTAPDKIFPPNEDLHNLKLDLNWSIDMSNSELKADKLICRIGLFSYFNAPEYIAVVGNVDKAILKQMSPFGNEK